MPKRVAASSILLIELSINGKSRVLAFRPGEERAVSVGSDTRAEFHVSGAGVAPIQFHIERRDDMAWLVPAYGLGDLRVNAQRVSSSMALDQQSVLEFGEVRIDATILDGSAAGGAVPSRNETLSLQVVRRTDVPDENDTTRMAMRPVTANTGIDAQVTALVRPLEPPPISAQNRTRLEQHGSEFNPLPTQVTERIPAPLPHSIAPAVPGSHTDEITLPTGVAPPGDEPPPTVRTRPPVSRVAAHPAPPQAKPRERPIQPLPVVPVTIAPRPRTPAAPQAAVAPTLREQANQLQTEETVSSRPAAGHSSPPTPQPTHAALRSFPPPASGRVSLLSTLGLLAKARPLLVACAAVATGLVLGTILLVATRIVEQRGGPMPASLGASGKPALAPPSPTVVPSAAVVQVPVEIVETAAPYSSGSPSAGVRRASDDPALSAAVAELVAGHYGQARAAYERLGGRPGSSETFSALARLLRRSEEPQCAATAQHAAKNCPGVER